MTAFFDKPRFTALKEVAAITGCVLPSGVDPTLTFTGIAPLDRAGPSDITFLDNPAYANRAQGCRAGACFVAPRLQGHLGPGPIALVSVDPYRAFATLASLLYPAAMRPTSDFGSTGVATGAFVHPAARLESGVVVDPGAIIGPGAEVGMGALVGAGAVIGQGVRIGRETVIGAGSSVQHALIGDRVILHPGVRVGQDGFGFAMGPRGHLKVPQIGRVIIQNDVEIGANSCVDRGMNRDTIIGEGTKIDNLVQIAHNVVIGRYCVIVSGVGISGSVVLEDFVVLGGQTGVVGHVTIGMGAQVAACSRVNGDVPRGARYGGTPAKPVKEWFRELTVLAALAKERRLVVSKRSPE